MAIPTTGNITPVALIGGVFAHGLAHASQMGDYDDGTIINPFDLFDSADVRQDARYAVVILNSMSTPLRLVDSYAGTAPVPAQTGHAPGQNIYKSYVTGDQANYPAVSDRGNQVVRPHEVPGARPFPNSQMHLRPEGGPKLMGGVGLYTFTPSVQKGAFVLPGSPNLGVIDGGAHIRRALSFSTSADGSGPQVAVAFRTKAHLTSVQPYGNRWTCASMHSTVTTDLKANYGDLRTFYEQAMLTDSGFDEGPDPSGKSSEVSPAGITIWAAFAKTPSQRGDDYKVLTVWVRDIASTLG